MLKTKAPRVTVRPLSLVFSLMDIFAISLMIFNLRTAIVFSYLGKQE